MKIAIISFSFTGHVNKIVDVLQKEIKAFELTFFPIECLDQKSKSFIFDYTKLSLLALKNKCGKIKPLSFDSNDFDHAIFVTPVWVGKLPPAMNTFFRDYEINCSYSVILSCFIEFDFILDNIQNKQLMGKGQLLEHVVIFDRKPELIQITIQELERSLREKLITYNKEAIHDDSLFS